MMRGSAFTAANFGLGTAHHIPGVPEITRHLGTEVSANDLVVATGIIFIGYQSDKYEASLDKSVKKIIKQAQVDFSGSTVIAVDD